MERNDQQLLIDFQACTISHEEWTHRAHVRMAYIYSAQNSLYAAIEKMRAGIQKLNKAHKTPDAIDRGYHETITSAFMRLVYETIRSSEDVDSSEIFCDQHPTLMTKRVLLNFYSRERIMSWDAKKNFIQPDIAPLPVFDEQTTIVQAIDEHQFQLARILFQEYADFLDVDLCFQNFDEELKTLPGKYEPPAGRLLLAYHDRQLAGCIALRPLEDSFCEMKRFWVRPEFRGKRIGNQLAKTLLEQAQLIGYSAMRLDTLRTMDKAIELYKSLGFQEIESYRYNPDERAVFLERKL